MNKKILLIAVCILCIGNFLFAQKDEMSTRSNQVHIVDSSFYIPQLNRYRRVWIYLPASYASSGKKYPVLYMQDGQNVFDKATSFSGEWGVDEALDSLENTYAETIVVAVDNGGQHRLNEYAPYNMLIRNNNDSVQINAEGDKYLSFLVNTLRPYINKNYRTKKCRRYTSIAGSSMGGLISFYAMLKYPKVYGAAGIFSPSFWVAPKLENLMIEKGKKVKGKMYFYAGKEEGKEMVTDMLAFLNVMNKYSKASITTVIRTDGKHNEATWQQEFPLFYRWLVTSK